MVFTVSFIIVGLCIVVFGNLGIHRYIVRTAINNYVEHYLLERHQSVARVSSTGFLNSGDFKTKRFQISVTSPNGKILNTAYAYIFVKDEFGIETRYTARIKTLFLKIYKVELKSGSQKILVVYK